MKSYNYYIIYVIFLNFLFFANSLNSQLNLEESVIFIKNSVVKENLDLAFIKDYKNADIKSPGKAMLFSGILPGMGQAYLGSWKRGLIFTAIDAFSLGIWHHNNILADNKKIEYSNYAGVNWSFANWIHDYYNWYDCEDEKCQAIRNIFLNSDSLYSDIWDHSHKVEFKYQGSILSSNDDEFKFIYKYLCDNPSILSKECFNNIDDINEILVQDSIKVITDHHFYEGIQKYDMFFSGWIDAVDSVFVSVKESGDHNVVSPIQNQYRNIWSDYNTIKSLAVNGGKFMLINRFVSMIDALLLAKKWNVNNSIKLSLKAYPNLKNKYGLGGAELSFYLQ